MSTNQACGGDGYYNTGQVTISLASSPYNPATQTPVPDISNIAPPLEAGERFSVEYFPDETATPGTQHVVIWTVSSSGIPIHPRVVVWPISKMDETPLDSPERGSTFTFTNERGLEETMTVYDPSEVTSELVNGETVFTHTNGRGEQTSWRGLPSENPNQIIPVDSYTPRTSHAVGTRLNPFDIFTGNGSETVELESVFSQNIIINDDKIEIPYTGLYQVNVIAQVKLPEASTNGNYTLELFSKPAGSSVFSSSTFRGVFEGGSTSPIEGTVHFSALMKLQGGDRLSLVETTNITPLISSHSVRVQDLTFSITRVG